MSNMMTNSLIRSCGTALLLYGCLVLPVQAQQAAVKIGFITTLSGPGGYIGEDIRDAFNLAVEQGGGRLGGVPVEVLVEDDGLRPGQAKGIAERMSKNNGVKLFTGIVFSNVLVSVLPDILDAGGIYVSPNAAPANFAGKECHKNYFVMSWQNDTLHEMAGRQASASGYKRAFILAPNYQAGKDALTGFKRGFQGEVVSEVYTRLDQTDYSAELAQIRAANADVVFQFHPGGLGIAFMRQYAQAGLNRTIPMVLPESSIDSTVLRAVGEAAEGVQATVKWNTDFDNPENKAFVDAFRKKYNRLPTFFAGQAYDAAMAIGAALKGTGGNIDNTDAFRASMLKTDFKSIRGSFAFGPNQHPVQDWYAIRVGRDAQGQMALLTGQKVQSAVGDVYSKDCKL